jgi:hypothetical protein
MIRTVALALVGLVCGCATPVPKPLMVPLPAEIKPEPKAERTKRELLDDARLAMADARKYEEISLKARQSDVIRSMEMTQRLRSTMTSLRRRNTTGTRTAVERATRELRDVTK